MKSASKLLSLSPAILIILGLLFPPVYALWLLALGNHLLEDSKRNKSIFATIASINVICFTIYPVSTLLLMANQLSIIQLTPIALITQICWLVTMVLLTEISITNERRLEPDNYVPIEKSSSDYISRFVLFVIWPLAVVFYNRKFKRNTTH